jgi:hypothetical protein
MMKVGIESIKVEGLERIMVPRDGLIIMEMPRADGTLWYRLIDDYEQFIDFNSRYVSEVRYRFE